MHYHLDDLSETGGRLEQRLVEPSHWETAPGPLHGPDSPLHNNPNLYHRYGDELQYNYAFATQFALTQELLANQGTDTVTGYFYTANSAAALAHTIRGYFDAQGATQPPIAHIDKTPRPERLQKVLRRFNITHAVILDQYTCSGNTLLQATEQLTDAGMPPDHTYAIGAKLYHQLYDAMEPAPDCRFANANPRHERLAARFYHAGRQLSAVVNANLVQHKM